MANLNIRHQVHYVPQRPGSMRCWAACIAMMTGRRGADAEALVEQVASEARARRVRVRVFFPNAGSLDEAEGPTSLAAGYNLARLSRPGDFPPRGMVVARPDTFATALARGPAIALGRKLDPGAGLHRFHAIVISGISGDSESLTQCHLHGMDPLPGGANFRHSVVGLQGHFELHHLLYRA
jgi:hypothetical protein